MFLRKLTLGALIASTSLQASSLCISFGEGGLTINPNYQLLKNAPMVPKTPTNKSAAALDVFTFLSMLAAQAIEIDPLTTNTSQSVALTALRLTQKAERKANQAALRRELRSPQKSYKPSVKSLHQPR
jgi:hypothetical protein